MHGLARNLQCYTSFARNSVGCIKKRKRAHGLATPRPCACYSTHTSSLWLYSTREWTFHRNCLSREIPASQVWISLRVAGISNLHAVIFSRGIVLSRRRMIVPGGIDGLVVVPVVVVFCKKDISFNLVLLFSSSPKKKASQSIVGIFFHVFIPTFVPTVCCVCFVWKHGVLCFMPSYAQHPCGLFMEKIFCIFVAYIVRLSSIKAFIL